MTSAPSACSPVPAGFSQIQRAAWLRKQRLTSGVGAADPEPEGGAVEGAALEPAVAGARGHKRGFALSLPVSQNSQSLYLGILPVNENVLRKMISAPAY